MSERIASLIGASRDPIKRIRSKEMRSEIEVSLASNDLSPDMLLRGFLAVGKAPPPHLLSEENIRRALRLEDCLLYLHRLTARAIVLDARSPLAVIAQQVRQNRPLSHASLLRRLARVAAKWTEPKAKKDQAKRKNLVLSPSDETVVQFLDTVLILLKSRSIDEHARQTSVAPKRQILVTLARAALIWASRSDDHKRRFQVLELICSFEKDYGIDFVELGFEEAKLGSLANQWFAKTLAVLGSLAADGNAPELRQWSAQLKLLRSKQREVQEEIKRLYDKSSRFSEGIQKELSNVLGLSEPIRERPEIHIDPADAVQTTQLASALLRSWEARQDSPKANDAFKELQSVSILFFGLKLGGEVESFEAFNPRVHEFVHAGVESLKIQIIRPWVELVGPNSTRIIIKALVRAIT